MISTLKKNLKNFPLASSLVLSQLNQAETISSSLPKPSAPLHRNHQQNSDLENFQNFHSVGSHQADFRLGYLMYWMSFRLSPMTYQMGFNPSLPMFFTLRNFLLKFFVISLISHFFLLGRAQLASLTDSSQPIESHAATWALIPKTVMSPTLWPVKRMLPNP